MEDQSVYHQKYYALIFLLKQPDGEFKELKWLDQTSIFNTSLLFWSAGYILCLGACLDKIAVANAESHFEASSVWIVGIGCISNLSSLFLYFL